VIRVATYNVHSFVGRDGRRDLARVARVIKSLGCHAIGLQEFDSRGAATALTDLEKLTKMSAVPGATIVTPEGDYGNVVLTDLELRSVNHHDLTIAAREPRGAIEVRLALEGGGGLTMITTHLGLRRSERRRQTQELLQICHRARIDPILVLMGDFNEWWPPARSLRELRRALGPTRSAASFPSSRPILALDRIWSRPCSAVQALRVVDTVLARQASDHLPVVAELSQPSRDGARPPCPERCPG